MRGLAASVQETVIGWLVVMVRSAEGQQGARSWLPRALAALLVLCPAVVHAEDEHPTGTEPAASLSARRDGDAQAESDAASDTPLQRGVGFLERLARDRFNRGVLERQPELLEQALDALELGMLLSPAPGLVFNAALVQQRLGHCSEAAELFRRFLALPTSGKSRERAEQQLSQLASCTESEPQRAALVLPGVSLEVELPPSAPDRYAPVLGWREFAESEPEPGIGAGRIAFWSLAAGAVLSAGYAVVCVAQAGSAHEDFERLATSGGDPEQLAAAQQAGQSAQTRARIFGGVAAGLGLGAGLVFWLTRGPSAGAEAGASGLSLVVEPERLGARWVQSF